MTAQPAEPAYQGRPEPTIRSVRDRLDTDNRARFNAEIDETPLHLIGEILAIWDLRARAYADPHIASVIGDVEDERAGRKERPRRLTDDEIQALHPLLHQ